MDPIPFSTVPGILDNGIPRTIAASIETIRNEIKVLTLK